jgi:hypothetical protein
MSDPQTTQLPGCEALFRAYFYAWYDESAVQRHPDRVRSDIEEYDLPVPVSGDALRALQGPTPEAAAERIEAMTRAATMDLARLFDCCLPVNRQWLRAVDAGLDRAEIGRLIHASDPRDFSNTFLLLTCEIGALLGRVLEQQERRLRWLYESPYWESALFDPLTATRINVFHWAMRRMSEDGVDVGLEQKVRAGLERLRAGPATDA